MLTEYGSEQDFAAAVESAVSAAPGDVGSAVLAGVLEGEDELRASTAGPSDLEYRVGRWFLRTEDVPFLESVAAVAAFATSVTGGAALPAAAIAAVAAFAGIAWRTWRSGGRLSRKQVEVLGVLSAHGPLEPEQLLELLNQDGEAVWNLKDLNKALLDLSVFEVNDGRTVALVESLTDQRWRARRV